jgi:hypothetical protein
MFPGEKKATIQRKGLEVEIIIDDISERSVENKIKTRLSSEKTK